MAKLTQVAAMIGLLTSHIGLNAQAYQQLDLYASGHVRQNQCSQYSCQQSLLDSVNPVGTIDQVREQKLGQRILLDVRHQFELVDDPWLEDHVLELFQSLYQQTGLGRPLGLVVINNRQINAFAVPGGVFAINSGTIAATQHLDELAAVMAHEIAHVSQRHYSRSQDNARYQSAYHWLGLLAGIAVSTQSPELGSAVMLGSQAASLNRQLAYSRDQEREADRIGMQFLYHAGYKPQAMADFFETMQRQQSRLSILPDFWLTHPLSSERLNEARLRASQYNASSALDEKYAQQQTEFALMKWRAMVLSGAIDLARLQSATQNGSKADQRAAQFALVSYLINQARFAEAKSGLQRLSAEKEHLAPKGSGDDQLLALLWTDYYLGLKQPQQALSCIRPLAMLMPENRALQLKLAEVYLANGQSDTSRMILQSMVQRDPLDHQMWRQLLQTEQQRPSNLQAVNVLRYRAEVQFTEGEIESAIRSLLQAQRLKGTPESLRTKIASRLTEMQSVYQLNL